MLIDKLHSLPIRNVHVNEHQCAKSYIYQSVNSLPPLIFFFLSGSGGTDAKEALIEIRPVSPYSHEPASDISKVPVFWIVDSTHQTPSSEGKFMVSLLHVPRRWMPLEKATRSGATLDFHVSRSVRP